jgi:hypothetical protein
MFVRYPFPNKKPCSWPAVLTRRRRKLTLHWFFREKLQDHQKYSVLFTHAYQGSCACSRDPGETCGLPLWSGI